MTIIAGFDCAVKNLGICYVEYNDNWQLKIAPLITRLADLYGQIKNMDKGEFINKALIIVKDINKFIDNIIKIKFFNVVDLIPEYEGNKSPLMIRTRRLKYLLNALDENLLMPNIVLIEYQMKQNDISRCISHQIAYHYTNYDNITIKFNDSINKSNRLKSKTNNKNNSGKTNNKNNSTIFYAVNEYILHNNNNNNNSCNTVEVVGTALKNASSFTDKGEYSNFILKYSNYIANKKHTDWNFKYFVGIFGGDEKDLLKGISNKTNDISDAFMMIFGWLKKRKLI